MGTMDLEANGLLRYALVVAHGALCLIQDLLPDPVKVVEALACRQTGFQHPEGATSQLGYEL